MYTGRGLIRLGGEVAGPTGEGEGSCVQGGA